jgi:predicted nucleic acid-binding protein
VYDAAYLDLALEVDAALATLDGDLRAAARAEGLAVIG